MTDYSKFAFYGRVRLSMLGCTDHENGTASDVTLAELVAEADRHWFECHAPQLTSNDPEPPVGTRVTDANGDEWEHVAAVAGGSYWLQNHTHYAEPESWAELIENYGPVKLVWP